MFKKSDLRKSANIISLIKKYSEIKHNLEIKDYSLIKELNKWELDKDKLDVNKLNDEFINDNALTVNISRLRNKLQNFGLENRIETRKGQGYKLL